MLLEKIQAIYSRHFHIILPGSLPWEFSAAEKAMFTTKILPKMAQHGLTFGEHCVDLKKI
jgi:hypothetical protein